MSAAAFLTAAKARLAGAGFELIDNVTHNSHSFDLVAVRKRVEATKFGAVHTLFVFETLPSINPAALREFSSACFAFVESRHRSGMPRGLGRTVVCFPVAMVPSVDAATIETVERRPAGKHWAGMVMPIVANLGTGDLHYLKKTPVWGAAYYRSLRKMVRELLG